MNQLLVSSKPTIEQMIDAWVEEKQSSKSGSARTEKAYRSTMQSFRLALQAEGFDLDSNPHALLRIAPSWAFTRSEHAKRTGSVAPATYNQRLAIISSFYSFLGEQARARNEVYPNPIKLIKKPKVQAYAASEGLDVAMVSDQLLSIDRSTVQGKRDYALLAIGLQTGRRATELVSLRMQHIKMVGNRITLHFDHCKGGKKMRDTLDPDTGAVLLDYLYTVYGEDLLQVEGDAPVWLSVSKQNKGEAITTHTLINICQKHLGVSQIHALRHTFAIEMMEAGAPITELQHRLGHENITTTSIYTKRLRSAENPYATKLSARFGIGKCQ